MGKNRELGATLIELTIGTAIGLIVIGTAYGLFNMAYQRQFQGEQKFKMAGDLRLVMDIISRELRPAAEVIDASSTSYLIVVNQDTNNDGLLNTADERTKICLDGAKNLLVQRLDTGNAVIATSTRNLSINTLTITSYYYHPAETFTDSNDNGRYDAGEAYLDADGDGVCDDGSSHREIINAAQNYNKINAFEVTLVCRVGKEQQSITNLIAPRNL